MRPLPLSYRTDPPTGFVHKRREGYQSAPQGICQSWFPSEEGQQELAGPRCPRNVRDLTSFPLGRSGSVRDTLPLRYQVVLVAAAAAGGVGLAR